MGKAAGGLVVRGPGLVGRTRALRRRLRGGRLGGAGRRSGDTLTTEQEVLPGSALRVPHSSPHLLGPAGREPLGCEGAPAAPPRTAGQWGPGGGEAEPQCRDVLGVPHWGVGPWAR